MGLKPRNLAGRIAKRDAPARTRRPRTTLAAPAKGRGAKASAAPAAPASIDAGLFAPLTDGERADALRLMTEDPRLSAMAKVGRYRVVAVEPLVVKPKSERAGRRLARIVAYDYASDRRVDLAADLEASEVFHVSASSAQPMLSAEEEAIAVSIAIASQAVGARLAMGDEPLSAMHYWSRQHNDMAYRRRSAAVLFGQPGGAPSLVAIVNLVDGDVVEVVSAAQW